MRNHPGMAGRESFDFGWTRPFASLAIVVGRRPGATTTFGSVLAGAGMSRGRGCATLVGRVSELCGLQTWTRDTVRSKKPEASSSGTADILAEDRIQPSAASR